MTTEMVHEVPKERQKEILRRRDMRLRSSVLTGSSIIATLGIAAGALTTFALWASKDTDRQEAQLQASEHAAAALRVTRGEQIGAIIGLAAADGFAGTGATFKSGYYYGAQEKQYRFMTARQLEDGALDYSPGDRPDKVGLILGFGACQIEGVEASVDYGPTGTQPIDVSHYTYAPKEGITLRFDTLAQLESTVGANPCAVFITGKN